MARRVVELQLDIGMVKGHQQEFKSKKAKLALNKLLKILREAEYSFKYEGRED